MIEEQTAGAKIARRPTETKSFDSSNSEGKFSPTTKCVEAEEAMQMQSEFRWVVADAGKAAEEAVLGTSQCRFAFFGMGERGIESTADS